ncbi:MAG: hypothetical protein Q8Q95_03410 [bacterium]|nr:hypothetical protein [bacterium]
MINLLPPQEKENIHNLLLRRQLHAFVFIIAIVFFGGAIFMLNTLVFLKIQSGELNQSINLETTTVEADRARSLEGDVKKLNLQLAKYQSFRESGTNLGAVLSRVSDLMPHTIALTSLNIETGSKKIILAGQAGQREDIVYMEDKIKKSEYFEKLDSPLTNYLQKNNPSFNFSFYFK